MNTTPVSLLQCLQWQPEGPAWNRFSEIYEPWLRRQLGRDLVQPADADDLVQEVMVVLMRELPAFQHSGRAGAFRTWLRRIVVNRLREFWRQRRYFPPTDHALAEKLDLLADDRSQLSQHWDHEHDRHVVGQLLESISSDFQPQTWLAFRAFVLEGRKAADVAADLGMSEGAVWTAKSHVLKRLRQVGKELLD